MKQTEEPYVSRAIPDFVTCGPAGMTNTFADAKIGFMLMEWKHIVDHAASSDLCDRNKDILGSLILFWEDKNTICFPLAAEELQVLVDDARKLLL